jgi:adenosine deaminase CECR1
MSLLPKTFGSSAEYLRARDTLVKAERSVSFRGVIEAATDIEQAASEILQKIKSEEEKTLHQIHPDGSGFEAGHKYLHGLASHVENSKLLTIARKAPKGCMLHCHYDCILPPDGMLQDAHDVEGLHIRSDVSLTSKGFFEHALPQLEVLPAAKAPTPNEKTDLFSKSYVPGSWMKYSSFLSAFPGGTFRAEEWIKRKIILSSDHAYNPEQTVNGYDPVDRSRTAG